MVLMSKETAKALMEKTYPEKGEATIRRITQDYTGVINIHVSFANGNEGTETITPVDPDTLTEDDLRANTLT